MRGLAEWAAEQAYGPRTAIEKTQNECAPELGTGRTPKLLGAGASLAYVIVGLVLSLRYGLLPRDAQSRVANAFYAIAGRTPHLASIGFVWNPLPSILEIPLVAFRGIWPALTQDAIAGVIVSAVSGGIAVAYVYKTVILLGIQRAWSIALTVIFALNPLIMFYAANGMSDMMFLSAMLGAGYSAIRYTKYRNVRAIVAAGVWLAIGFGYRYEGAVYAVTLVLVLVPLTLTAKGNSERRDASALVLLGVPLTYVGGLWVLVNWVIMGNPLYFLNSPYSNAAQTKTGAYANTALTAAYHDPLASIWFAVEHLVIYPPVVVMLFLVVWWLLRGTMTPFVWVVMALGVADPLVQVVSAFVGASSGQERYFLFYVPLGVLLGASAVVRSRRSWRLVVVGALALGNVGTIVASSNTILGGGVSQILPAIASGSHARASLASAPMNFYLSSHRHAVVLVDTFEGWAIVLGSSHPSQFLTTNDPQFAAVLSHPVGHVNAILVPEPRAHNISALDAVNRRYPMLWAGGEPWTRLLAKFPGRHQWRLYAVVPPGNAGRRGGPKRA